MSYLRAARSAACLLLLALGLVLAPVQAARAQTASHELVAVVADVVGLSLDESGAASGAGTREYRIERTRRGDVEVVTLIPR